MMKARFALLAVVLAIALGVGLVLGFALLRQTAWGNSARALNTAVIITRVQTLSQLVTVKYVLEKVVLLEDVKWYGENRLLLVAHGVVKAGVDLQRLKPGDLRVDQKKITVSLPPAQITDVYLDDRQTKVIERTTGLIRSFDKDLEQNARRAAVDDLRYAARQSGIVPEAEERARLQLTLLLRQLGFESVEFR